MSTAPRSGAFRQRVNIVLTGMFFGMLQWGAFFLLQSYLSSVAIVYLLATTVWLLGSLVGLAAPGRSRESYWLAVATGCYYLLWVIARADPYDLRLLPLLLLFIGGSGAYAGRFFRYRGASVGKSKWLFFAENCGFVTGMIVTVLALFFAGELLLLVAPAVGAVGCLLTLPASPIDSAARAPGARLEG